MFTHHVDVGGRVSRPAHQPGSAAYDFDFIENRGITRGIAKVPAVIEKCRHVLIGKVADEETARVEVGTAGINA
ncbi:hypothetical protein D3C80_1078370 [compost metagenome]